MEFQLGMFLQFGMNVNALQIVLSIVLLMHIVVSFFLLSFCSFFVLTPFMEISFKFLCQEVQANHRIFTEQTSCFTKVMLLSVEPITSIF
jgi:hypothetical protein